MAPDKSLEEVVEPVDRITTLTALYNKMGQIGLGKLYSLACGLYKYMYLSEDCEKIHSEKIHWIPNIQGGTMRPAIEADQQEATTFPGMGYQLYRPYTNND